jgi:hypothetical protein
MSSTETITSCARQGALLLVWNRALFPAKRGAETERVGLVFMFGFRIVSSAASSFEGSREKGLAEDKN